MKNKIWIKIFIVLCFLILLPTKSVYAHTHTSDCYGPCTGVDYNGDGVINYADCIDKPWTGGYSYGDDYICRGCNKVIYSTGYGQGISGLKKETYPHGINYNTPICNNVDLESITATNPIQLVAKGTSIVTTATAKYTDGTTKAVTCTCSGYNADTLSTQSVTLSYTDKGITATTTISVTVSQAKHTHEDSCFTQCTGLDYNGDGVFNAADCITQSTGGPNWSGTNYICRGCNQVIYQEGGGAYGGSHSYTYAHGLDRTKPKCLASQTPPSIDFSNSFKANPILTENDSSFPLQVNVSDHFGDNVLCYYYIDTNTVPESSMIVTGTDSEKTVEFPKKINANNLTEGNHTIRITAKNSICPNTKETTIQFTVDRSAPKIESTNISYTSTSLTIDVTASDQSTPLFYKYVIPNVYQSDWITSNSLNKHITLKSNTNYDCIVSVKDNANVKDSVNHSASQMKSFVTAIDKPQIEVTKSSGSIQLNINDNNPDNNLYKIKVGDSKFIDANGNITSSEKWISPYNASIKKKQIDLKLPSGASYKIQVYAKNNVGGADAESNSIDIVTAPTVPANFKATTGYENNRYYVKLTWERAAGATSYEIYKEPLTTGETSNTSSTSNAEYIDNNVSSNQTYRYKIRSVNGNGTGDYSPIAEVKTLPELPTQVVGIVANIKGSVLNLTWNAVAGATGYSVKVTANGAEFSQNTVENKVTIDTKSFNSQCDVVICANNATGQGKEGKATFYTLVNTPVLKDIKEDTITSDSIPLQWEANGNPQSVVYNISVISAKSQNSIDLTTYSIDNGIVTYNVTGLDQDTAYTFKVIAKNDKAQSEWSAVKSATTSLIKPDDPSGLNAINTKGIIYLNWNPADYAKSYIIERTCGNEIIKKNLTVNSYKDTETISGKTYSYKVKAVNKTVESNWSKPFSVIPEQTQVPAAIEASGSSMSIKVTWKAVDGASGYDIEVDGKDCINLKTDTSYEHIGLTPGSTHSYRVRSRNPHGESEWSDPVIGQTIPDSPGNLVVNASKKEIHITWDAVNGAASYEIKIDGKDCGNTVDAAYSYTISDEKTEHMISVRAVNQSGASSWSILVKAQFTDNELPVIVKPAIPKMVVAASGTAINIKWNKCEGATSYQLEADGKIIYIGANTSFNQTGLEENSEHVYRIQASNFGVYSGWSDPLTAVTGKLSSTKPKNITYYRENDNTTVITWDKVPDIEKYRIEIKKGNTVILDSELSMNKAKVSITPGETYTIRIAAVKTENGTSTYEWSDKLLMVAPSLLPAVPKMNDLKLAVILLLLHGIRWMGHPVMKLRLMEKSLMLKII